MKEAYSTEFGGKYFHIPEINLKSQEVAAINEEIWKNLYDGVVVGVTEDWNQWHNTGSEHITYNWYVNKNILSLVIESHPYDYAWRDYYVYNIDIRTGREISSSELLDVYEISPDAYNKLAEQVLGSKFWTDSSWCINDQYIQYGQFTEALRNTISSDNIAKAIPYINGQGELCIIAKVYSLAGAGSYWWDLNMVDYTFIPDYLEYVG